MSNPILSLLGDFSQALGNQVGGAAEMREKEKDRATQLMMQGFDVAQEPSAQGAGGQLLQGLFGGTSPATGRASIGQHHPMMREKANREWQAEQNLKRMVQEDKQFWANTKITKENQRLREEELNAQLRQIEATERHNAALIGLSSRSDELDKVAKGQKLWMDYLTKKEDNQSEEFRKRLEVAGGGMFDYKDLVDLSSRIEDEEREIAELTANPTSGRFDLDAMAYNAMDLFGLGVEQQDVADVLTMGIWQPDYNDPIKDGSGEITHYGYKKFKTPEENQRAIALRKKYDSPIWDSDWGVRTLYSDINFRKLLERKIDNLKELRRLQNEDAIARSNVTDITTKEYKKQGGGGTPIDDITRISRGISDDPLSKTAKTVAKTHSVSRQGGGKNLPLEIQKHVMALQREIMNLQSDTTANGRRKRELYERQLKELGAM